MSQEYLETLQKVEVELLRRAVEFFEENEIEYFIIGGTLLGAARTGGFIPWDDDIDIAVPRDSYVKLIEKMNELGDKDELLGMKYYRNEPELYYYPVRLVHKGYAIEDQRLPGQQSNPWMDILPIDGWPDGKLKGRIFKAKMLYYRLMLGLHYSDNLRDKKRSLPERIIIKFAQITKIGKRINPTKVKDKIDKTLSSNKWDDCTVVGTCMGAYFFHEFVPKKYFGKGSEIEFEGMTLRAPQYVDRYLTHMYGDYKTPVKPEDAVSHLTGEVTKL